MPGPTTKPSPATSASSLSRALTLLHLDGVTRRSELTSRLGLTRTATGTVLRELEQLGLVVTRTGGRPGAGTGRPSHGIEPWPQAPMVVAVHVGVETVLVAEAELGAVLGPVTEVPLPDPATPEAVLGLVVDRVRMVLDRATWPCAGVGVSVLPTAVGADDRLWLPTTCSAELGPGANGAGGPARLARTRGAAAGCRQRRQPGRAGGVSGTAPAAARTTCWC